MKLQEITNIVLDILEHDLFSKNVFSDGDFTKKLERRKILVKKLDKSFHVQSEMNRALVIDFTSIICRLQMHNMAVFYNLVQGAWTIIKTTFDFQRHDIVFNS